MTYVPQPELSTAEDAWAYEDECSREYGAMRDLDERDCWAKEAGLHDEHVNAYYWATGEIPW